MYDGGLGCAKNLGTAVAWYRKAAEAGNPLAENNLGDMYLRGEGVTQNDAAAFSWFQKAAAQGHTGARIKLGYLYSEGRGTPKDREAAYSSITAATMAGDPRGNDLLHSLEKSLRPEQIKRACQRASSLSQAEPQLSEGMFAQ
jgi:TPR repeat protein